MSLWRTQIKPVLTVFAVSTVTLLALGGLVYQADKQTRRIAHHRQRQRRVKTQGKSGLLSLPNEARGCAQFG